MPETILFLDHATQLSGAELSLLSLAKGLDRQRYRPVVVLPDAGPLAEALEQAGVEVRFVPMGAEMLRVSREYARSHPLRALGRGRDMLLPALRIRRLIRETGAAIVHTNSVKSHFLGALAVSFTPAKLIVHERNILDDSTVRRWLLRIADWRAARVIAISDAVAAPYRERLRHPTKVVTVYNGIDVARFAAADGAAFRQELGLGPEALLVVQVGQIARWKGQDIFLRAAAQVAGQFPAAQFAIVGKVLFPQNEAAYEKHLHVLVEHLGLEGRVRFVGQRDDIPQVLAAADVVVHPAAEPEPFGRVLAEAMAAGKPVVASACGGTPEIIADGETGVLVPPGEPGAIVEALAALLADPTRRLLMGQAGRRRAAERFSEARMIAGVQDCYRAVLGSSASAAREAEGTCGATDS